MLELNKTFMYLGKEYRITRIDEKKNKINIDLIDKTIPSPEINDKIEIENKKYKVIYVHQTLKRISVVQI